ncbi:MAG: YeeE/YedE family protein [Trueperaceae bacterium]|nr:YeeE/YedE family protein [Trueperaceae bacterium]
MLSVLASGLAVGLAFGYALQRGRFCTNTGFRDALLINDGTLLRAWALAVVVQLLGVTALSGAGLLPVSVPPFWWAANVLGGVTFGVGMVLAGGCSSGTCYRVGEGLAGSLVALIAFGVGIVVMARGALAPLQDALQGYEIGAEGGSLTVANLLGVSPWVVVVPVTIGAAVWFWRAGASRYRSGGWDWRAAGASLGLIGIAAWLASSGTGRPFGLSMTGPLRSWFEGLFAGDLVVDWGSMLIVGLLLGSFLSAWSNGELRWRVPKGGRLLQSGVGGLAMGFGAQLAGGCTIGHSLTGLSVLSVGSIVTTLGIVAGAWGMATWLFVLPARRMQREMAAPAATD